MKMPTVERRIAARAAAMSEAAPVEGQISAIDDWLESDLPELDAANELHALIVRLAAASGIRMGRYPSYSDFLKRLPASAIAEVYGKAVELGMPVAKELGGSDTGSFSFKNDLAKKIRKDPEALGFLNQLYKAQPADPNVVQYRGAARIWNLDADSYQQLLQFMQGRQ